MTRTYRVSMDEQGRVWYEWPGGRRLPVIAGAADPPQTPPADPPQDPPAGGGGGGAPTLEEQATSAVEKLDRGETPTPDELSALRKATGDLTKARKEAARHRGETRAEKTAREAAEQEAAQLRAKLDPEGETERRRQAEQDRLRQESEERQARLTAAEERVRELELHRRFDAAARQAGVSDRLAWALAQAEGKLTGLDPTSDSIDSQLGELLTDLAKTEPALRSTAGRGAGTLPPRSGGEPSGVTPPRQRPKGLYEAVAQNFAQRQ